ncbi:MAG: hypothetical protein RLY86_1130 [Pseudomonadota bacterium]
MTNLTIYMEGGGDTAEQKAQIRQGMDTFLSTWKNKARQKRWGWKLVPCGGRQQTYDAFINARCRAKDGEIIVLLVDSEAPVTAATRAIQHLRNRQGDHTWDLSGVPEEHIHLMVQAMEAWLAADPDKLEEWYGSTGFRRANLPQRQNLEEEPKDDLEPKLKTATRETRRREYHKIRHASELLKLIRPEMVRQRCPRAGIFFDKLDELIG